MLLWLSEARHISFILNLYSVEYIFPFPILRLLPQNHLTLLKDRFVKKMLIKRAKTRRLFASNYRFKQFFYSNWKQFQGFEIYYIIIILSGIY